VKIGRLNADLHRDVGYFLSGLVLIYCISGLALNHVNEWNADFIILKKTITLDRSYTKEEITAEHIAAFSALVGEDAPRIHDFPTPSHVKVYYENASLLVDLKDRKGSYEEVTRRPVIFQSNVLHRNSLKGWKWAADVFSVLLAFLVISGWFMLKGRRGVAGRGKWLIAAGMLPPVAAFLLFELVQK